MTSLTRRDLLRSGIALSATSLVPGSATARAEELFSGLAAEKKAALDAPGLDLAAGPRERLLLDFGWKFFQGNNNDPALDLNFGATHEAFAKSGNFAFSEEGFDDSKWRPVDLPHDWAVELPFVNDPALKKQGYKPLGRTYPATSVGWYRRSFEIPKEDLGRRISVQFDGAMRSALIFVNGYFIGRNDNGYAPFSFDLSDFLVYGGENYLVARMDAAFGDSWFYEGAGIYRHVWLDKTAALHLGRWESYVRSEADGGVASLSLGTVVQNDGMQAAACSVEWTVLDAAKNVVARGEAAPQTIAAISSASFAASATLARPALWSPETPNLYTAVVTVKSAGKVCDAERVSFGVRTVVFDANKGLLLNGREVKIKGTCNHQDHAGVGAALPDRLQWYRLGVLQSMGSNAVRTSHNMPTPEFVEACDHMGMMMMCETRQMSSSPEGLAQLEVMIKRYRNSPAIIIWSMGNEEKKLQSEDAGERVMATMIEHGHALDPTRRCTAAVNSVAYKGLVKSLDVEGVNYHLPGIDAFHKAHPERPMLGSETASALATRGIYATDKDRHWMSAYDVNHPEWGETSEQWWTFYAQREWLAGGFAWTGFDYRGEPTPYSWPSISSQFGIVDTCGFAKDSFFYYKAWWGSEPVLHLFPHWNWKQQGGTIPVWVHSNLDEVELFLNGKSQGSQKVQPLTHLEWKVKYEPGTIEARGSKAGKVVLVERRETTGEAATLRLTADRMEIDADGADLAMVRVEALDKQGRAVPTASERIGFKVSGAGALLGVGNGDPNCLEPDKGSMRSLFSGLAQAIVQAGKTAGDIVVVASVEGRPEFPSATLTIAAKKVELRPSL